MLENTAGPKPILVPAGIEDDGPTRTEEKPAETKPGETKPGETKPGETKPPEPPKKTAEELQKEYEAALKKYEEGNGYISYDKVTDAQRKELTDVVNALGEPLSKLAAAVV